MQLINCLSCFFRPTRSRSCCAWCTLVVWSHHWGKRCGLSCWVITSLVCQRLRERRFVVSMLMVLNQKPFPPKHWSFILYFFMQVDDQVRVCYQQTMGEWLSCEEIVRQREKEQHAAALAKCSSGASMDSYSQKIKHHDSTVSNEVKQQRVHMQTQRKNTVTFGVDQCMLWPNLVIHPGTMTEKMEN